MMKKLLTLFVAFIATCALWAGNVITYTASEKLKEETYSWYDGLHTNAFNVSIISHTFSDGTGTITFAGEVTSIGDRAFYKCSGLTSITIPNSVTSIGNSAFYGCSELTSITIPNSVTSIGNSAFYDCSGLTSITIPNSVTSIGDDAFYKCSGLKTVVNSSSLNIIKESSNNGYVAYYAEKVFTGTIVEDFVISNDMILSGYIGQGVDVVIPEAITRIEERAFYECYSITSVTIPAAVTNIAFGAFDGCKNLTSIFWNATRCKPTSRSEYCDGPDCPVYKGAFYSISNQITSFIIGKNVESLPSYLCYGMKNLSDIHIPESVISIGDEAFSGCSGLTKPISNSHIFAYLPSSYSGGYEIANGITSIAGGAFYGCSGLTDITIPSSVASIGDEAFTKCSNLVSILVESGNTTYDSRDNCNALIATATNHLIVGCNNSFIPHSVSSIGKYAFYDCSSLSSITIPSSVTYIGEYAFYGCSELTSITIPEYVTKIGYYAFRGCTKLRSVFWNAINCELTRYYMDFVSPFPSDVRNFTIGDKVKRIPESLCSGLSLTSITIPNSVTSIEKSAFFCCMKLKTVYNNSNLDITKGSESNGYVAYYADNVYEGIPVDDFVIRQGKHLTAYIGNGGDVMIPDSIISIGDKAFHHCSTITSITIPESIKKIGKSICAGCSELKSIIWNAPSITGEMYHEDNTSYSPFYGAESVLSFVFGPKVEIIPAYICYNMPISDIIIPQSVKTIEYGAFRECSELTSVTIPNSVTSIGNYAFSGCKNRAFTKLNIPHSVKSMGDYAFANCEYLTSISFGDGLEEIGDYAFSGCIRVNDMTSFATITPSAGEHTFDKVNHLAYLFVQAGSKRTYQLDPIWGVFDIHEIGAESSTTVDNSVQVIPQDNEASFTWPLTEDAATYTLVITRDGVVFCTLIFTANGQLQGIAFAPARDGSAHAPAAMTSMAGMNFTVTGLDGASKYAYRLAAKDNSGSELIAYVGEFATVGYEGEVNIGGQPEGEGTGHPDINSETPSTKLLRDGQLLIQRNDKTYNMQGAQVK